MHDIGATMKLFFTPHTCSLACHIALTESGVKFDQDKVNLATKKTASGVDFRALNPKGSVPALEVSPGQVLTEGVAIMQYVADSVGGAGVVPANGTFERARMQEAMNFISGELHKTGYGPLFRPGITDAEKQAQFAIIDTKLAWIEDRLGKSAFMAGDTFSLADSYLWVISGWSAFMGHDLGKFPKLMALRALVGARPAVQAAVALEA